MKKKYKFIIFFIILILIVGVSFVVYNNLNKKHTINTTHKKIKHKKPTKKTSEIEDNYGDSDGVKVKADDYIIASGYAGAGDNAYYIKDNNLYHVRISTNERTKIAEGVKKIEADVESLKAYKGKNFKIVTEDEYVDYVE